MNCCMINYKLSVQVSISIIKYIVIITNTCISMHSFLLIVILLSMTILTSSFRLSNRLVRSPLKISMMSSNSNNSKKFILEYQYVSDILEKRVPYRSEHLALAEDLEKQGKIIAAGPFTPPTG